MTAADVVTTRSISNATTQKEFPKRWPKFGVSLCIN